jgi:hypothetical protein
VALILGLELTSAAALLIIRVASWAFGPGPNDLNLPFISGATALQHVNSWRRPHVRICLALAKAPAVGFASPI